MSRYRCQPYSLASRSLYLSLPQLVAIVAYLRGLAKVHHELLNTLTAHLFK